MTLNTIALFDRLDALITHWMAHYGILLLTRVRVTADGVVSFVGRRGGYGKVVVVDHRNGYSTLYGHLSGFANDVEPGRRVNQGESIGYVGMTGLATGPHLHYEFLVHGVHKDPLSQALPEGSPITRETRQAFEEATRSLLGRLDLMQDMNLGMN